MAKVALLVGGKDIQPDLSSEMGSARNVEALKQVLRHPEIGNFTQIKTLTNPDPLVLQQEIEALFGDRQRDDLVLLYFCGQGVRDSQGKLYLGTSIHRQDTQGKLPRSSIVPASFIQDVMNSSRAHQQVVILDCWFDLTLAEERSAQDSTSGEGKSQLGGQQQAILIASTPTNGALRSQADYTQALIEGLETGAADLDNDGVIAIHEWHEYTKGYIQTVASLIQPEIYTVKAGHKILLAKALVSDPKRKYRQEVERRAKGGEISLVTRGILDVTRDRLGLLPGEAAVIEASTLNSPSEKFAQIRSRTERNLTSPEVVVPLKVPARETRRQAVATSEEPARIERPQRSKLQAMKVALLVGVSDCGAGFNPLPGTAKDVEAMKRVLQHPDRGGFAEVRTLSNPNPLVLQQAIEDLFGDRQPDDLALLYFSGHGVKDDRSKLYLTTGITRKDTQGKLVKSTAVPASFLQDVMSDSQSQRQVVILDCWFGETFTENWLAESDSSVDVKSQLGGPGRVVLVSSTSTQSVFEQKGSDLSEYTDYLVEGLETGAADVDNDAMVSLDELHEYARRKVQKSTPAAQPEVYGINAGDKILLAKAPIDDVGLRYRKEVERCASYGGLSIVSRSILDVLREKLDLPPEEATAIEAQVLKPHQAYQKKLQRYTQVLVEAVQQEYPLKGDTRSRFKRFQQVLGLRDQDVTLIEVQVARQVKGDQSLAPATSSLSEAQTVGNSETLNSVKSPPRNTSPGSTAARSARRLIPAAFTARRNLPRADTGNDNGSGNGTNFLSLLQANRNLWWVGGAVIVALLTLVVGLAYGQRQRQNPQQLEKIQSLADQRNYQECLNAAQTIPENSPVYTEAQRLVRQCQARVSWQNVQVQSLAGHSGTIWSIALSPDGQTLASSSQDSTIKLWNLNTGRLLQTLFEDDDLGSTWSVAISPDGQTLASGSSDQTIKLWNLQTGELRRTLSGHTDTVRSVAISPDGQTLASGSGDQTIKLWNLQTGELRRTLSGHTDRAISIAISPDGQTLASGSTDNTIKIWNLQSGESLHTLSGHQSHVNSVAIAADGQTFASGSEDRTIKIWNLPTGELLHTFPPDNSDIYAIAFSPDGQLLISGSEDGEIKIRRQY